MRSIAIRLVALLLISFVLHLPCETRGECRDDCERQFAFAEDLFNEADYFRAISEYKRLIFLCPGSKQLCEIAHFRIGLSYFRANRWQNALEAFGTFLLRFPDSPMKPHVLYLKGMSEKNLSLHGDALATFAHLMERTGGEYQAKATYQSALIFVDREEWERAGEMFSRISEESALYNSARVFSAGLEQIDCLPHKSPPVAGTLAAVLPGVGHLYTERPKDALVAFLLNGFFIWSAIELFEDDKHVTGGIVTFFELGWYTGNIYSAVSSAHKFNKRTQDDFIKGLRDRVTVSYLHTDDTRCDGIMLSMHF